MALCTNRPEGFGPNSHQYNHILTSCFLDTVLVPLCTWLYLFVFVMLLAIPTKHPRNSSSPSSGLFSKAGAKSFKGASDTVMDEEIETSSKPKRRGVLQLTLSVLYYLLLVAQFLMCTLEITRLSLANLGIGLLPFTYVTLIVAFVMRLTKGFRGRVQGWRWANVAVFVALAIANGVKIAEEVKEGIDTRKGTKYPESDEVIDVAVMVGVYVALVVLELLR